MLNIKAFLRENRITGGLYLSIGRKYYEFYYRAKKRRMMHVMHRYAPKTIAELQTILEALGYVFFLIWARCSALYGTEH